MVMKLIYVKFHVITFCFMYPGGSTRKSATKERIQIKKVNRFLYDNNNNNKVPRYINFYVATNIENLTCF